MSQRESHKRCSDFQSDLCCVLQSRQVRQSAAENLGELTRMSMRLDQLASDLINNSKAADSAIQVWTTLQPSA